MKSIYSIPVLQRILDHFGVGKIIYVTYFSNIGSQVWRHSIETTRGDFELYSYPVEIHEYAQQKISSSSGRDRGYLYPNLCHSFDRYHQLKQLTKKFSITLKQLSIDMLMLKNLEVEKIYRVYGSIVYIDFENDAYISSYGAWKVFLKREREDDELLIDTDIDSKERIDYRLEVLTEKKLHYESYQLKGDIFEVLFSDGYYFQFTAYKEARLQAGSISLPGRKKRITLFDEREIFYEKEV